MQVRSDVAAASALALAAGVLRVRPTGAADMGWHLSGGRAVLEAGARVYDDPLTIDATAQFANNSWLFDVVAYLLWGQRGAPALALLAGVCATLSTLITWRIAADVLGPAGRWRAVAIAGASAGVASIRFFPRPQLFFLVCLAATIWTTRQALKAEGRAQLAWAAGLLAVVTIWAQSHLSVFIAPFVVAGSADRWPDRRLWPFAAVGLALPFTGAEGFGLIEQVFGYTGGDAAASIQDTQPMYWDWIVPPDGPEILLMEVLLGAAVIGSIRARKLPLLPMCLGLLGVYLTLKTHRFVSAAGILIVPWVAEVWRPTAARTGEAALAALAATAGLLTSAQGWAPGMGLERAEIPVDLLAAADALALEGNGFTDYDIGGWMGFERYGATRVYIDARTLVFHEDSRYFAQRAALEDAGTLAMLDARYAFDWVAIPRRAAACGSLSGSMRWSPMFVDANRAIFVRGADPRALRAIDPCAGDEVLLTGCRQDPEGAAAWRADIEQIVSLVPGSGWASRMGAALYVGCGVPDEAATARHLEVARAIEPDHEDLAWLGGKLALVQGDPNVAIQWFATADEDDVRSHATRAALLLELGRPEEARAVAQSVTDTMIDETPPALRSVLATACLQTGDLRCAAEQALRGALRGDRRSADLLAREEVYEQLTEDERGLAGAARGR